MNRVFLLPIFTISTQHTLAFELVFLILFSYLPPYITDLLTYDLYLARFGVEFDRMRSGSHTALPVTMMKCRQLEAVLEIVLVLLEAGCQPNLDNVRLAILRAPRLQVTSNCSCLCLQNIFTIHMVNTSSSVSLSCSTRRRTR